MAEMPTTSSHNVGGQDSLEMFQKSWSTYRAVLAADLMEHKSLTKSISDAISAWLTQRQSCGDRSLISVADLGCGDLAFLAPLYKCLPLRQFCGVDMSQPALELAGREFREGQNGGDYDRFKQFHDESVSSPLAPTVKWINADVLNWASLAVDEKPLAETEEYDSSRYDIILCAFVIHHLSDQDKRAFLRNILLHRVNPGGIVLMADVYCSNSEDREQWLSRFFTHIASWTAITEAQKKDFYAHVSSSDYPASIEDFVAHIAPESGWSAELLWTNSTEVERLVILRQIPSPSAQPLEEGKSMA